MLKDYLKNRGISMYRLSADSGVPYSTINDIANGRVSIDNCRAGILFDLSRALDISMDDLYGICDRDMTVHSDKYGIDIDVIVKDKTYRAQYEYEQERYDVRVCEAGADYIPFVKDLALWEVEDDIDKRDWGRLNEILANEKK